MVRLLANVQGFTAGMSQAQAATTRLGTQFRGESETVGRALTGIGLAAAAGVGVAIAKFAEFDQSMSFVQAATHESAANMELLRDAALEAGATTVFSATESANAIEELAKAGISTAQIMGGGLTGSLDLAAAGGLGVADAAAIAATAMTQFGVAGSEVPHIADLLAAGAGKAQGSVEELAAALNQGGLVASQTGLSIEETTGTLAAFASAGLIGSDAGTSFKSMLQRLTPQSAEAKAKMDELGISAYDAQGQFIGMEQFAGNLQQALKDLTPEARNSALGVIFGSDAVRAASVIYNEGAEGIAEWTDKVDDSGYAAETAAMRLDNLAGDVEALGGAFDTALIQTGSMANDFLRANIQLITSMVDVYNSLPAPVQGGVLAVGALVAVIGLAGGAFLLAVPKIVEFRLALGTLSSAFPAVAGAARGVMGVLGGPWGIAITLAITALSMFGASQIDAAAKADSYADTIDKVNGRITDSTREMVQKNLTASDSFAWIKNTFDGSAYDAAKKLGLSLTDVTDAALGNVEALERLNKATANFVTGGEEAEKMREKAGLSEGEYLKAIMAVDSAISGESGSVERAIEIAKQKQEADKKSSASTEDNATSLEQLAGVANTTSTAVSDLADEIRNFGSAQFDVEESTVALYDAFRDLQENLDSGSASLDVTTQAGSDTANSLLGAARAANENAAAIAAVGGTTEQIAGALDAGRQRIIDARMALGESREAATKYADALIATPAAVQTTVTLTGIAAAQAQIDEYIRQNQNRVINIEYRATLPDLNGPASGSGRPGLASGGYTGDGGKHDIAPYNLHRGEYVNNKESTAKPGNRRALEFMNSGGDIAEFQSGFADGGFVPTRAEGGYVSGPVSQAAPYMVAAPQQSGGVFQGNLYLSSGEFLGMVRGELAQADTNQRVSLENGLGR